MLVLKWPMDLQVSVLVMKMQYSSHNNGGSVFWQHQNKERTLGLRLNTSRLVHTTRL